MAREWNWRPEGEKKEKAKEVESGKWKVENNKWKVESGK